MVVPPPGYFSRPSGGEDSDETPLEVHRLPLLDDPLMDLNGLPKFGFPVLWCLVHFLKKDAQGVFPRCDLLGRERGNGFQGD